MAWQRVAEHADLPPGKSAIVNVGGKEVGIFNDGGTVYAVLNFCPHMGAPLCAGAKITPVVTADAPGEPARLDGDRRAIRCPWHHWEFDLATGKAVAQTREKIRTYPVQLRDGGVWIDV